MQKPIVPLPTKKDAGNETQMTVGKTVFTVKVHFGKVPLEEILRNRILGERGRKTL